jgi:hypothetical protein
MKMASSLLICKKDRITTLKDKQTTKEKIYRKGKQ